MSLNGALQGAFYSHLGLRTTEQQVQRNARQLTVQLGTADPTL